MSMAAKWSNLGDKMSGANLQMDGHVDMPSQSAKDLQMSEASRSSPSHLPSWSPARRPLSSCPNIKHCLEIHVILSEELGAVPPPSHSWMAPLMEDMLHDIRTGLTEAVVTGPGRAILFYGRCLMGEGLTADEARDAKFLLTGAGTWVGKLAYLTVDPMRIQEGWWAIAQAIMDSQVKARGPGCSCVNPLAQQPFRFDHRRGSPIKDAFGDGGSNYQPLLHWPLRGQDCSRCQRDQRPPSPQFPSPSLDCGFGSDGISLSTASLLSSRSDRSDGSWHPWWGRWHWEDRAHMKINLPVLKDKDAKDAVTYQSWRWDLMVYRHAGCRDCTLLPYAIRSLQGYPGELVRSSSTDITLDNVLTILDKHYNNMKALDTLNQELFQLWMADKETVSDWGIHLSRHLQVLAASFPNCFPPDQVAELKRACFYGRLPKWLKVMVAYLKAGPQVRTYSDYLRAAWGAKKEDSIELPQGPRTQMTDNPPKPRTTCFFPLRKLKGNQPILKKPAAHLAHLEAEDASDDEDQESDNPSRIKGVMEEFMVHLARAVKDAQADEKHCYHCSSPEHFICNCLLIKTSRERKQLNGKEGMASMKGALTPLTTTNTTKSPQMKAPKA